MSAQDAFIAKTVGTSVERIEDLRLLRGLGQYVDDLHPEGVLHAAILRSSVAHGRIRSSDVKAALAMPGIRGVFTAEDVARGSGGSVPTVSLRLAPLPELEPFGQPVIAHKTVRYVGEPLAVVVADSAGQAEDATEVIEVDIESLPVVPGHHPVRRGDREC